MARYRIVLEDGSQLLETDEILEVGQRFVECQLPSHGAHQPTAWDGDRRLTDDEIPPATCLLIRTAEDAAWVKREEEDE